MILGLLLCGIGAAVDDFHLFPLAWPGAFSASAHLQIICWMPPQTESLLPGEDDATRALNQSLRRMADESTNLWND